MYIYGNKLSQLANQISEILIINRTIRKRENRSEIAKMAKMNTCVLIPQLRPNNRAMDE